MALQDLGGAAALRNFGVERPEWPQGWWVRREMGKRSSCRAGAQHGTVVLVHSGLQQQEAPKGRAEQQGEVVPAGICVCGPGGRDRKDLVSVKWCGSHLCTRVTAQVARELGVSTGRALEAAVVWCEGLAVLGRALGTPSVCWVWTQV